MVKLCSDFCYVTCHYSTKHIGTQVKLKEFIRKMTKKCLPAGKDTSMQPHTVLVDNRVLYTAIKLLPIF